MRRVAVDLAGVVADGVGRPGLGPGVQVEEEVHVLFGTADMRAEIEDRVIVIAGAEDVAVQPIDPAGDAVDAVDDVQPAHQVIELVHVIVSR